jgi:hypothetical protein
MRTYPDNKEYSTIGALLSSFLKKGDLFMGRSRLVFWIVFILMAASGGFLGYYFAAGEPTVFSEQYLKDAVLAAANTDVVLADDAKIEIEYTYLMCGHREKVYLNGDMRFTGKTAEEIKTEWPNTVIRDFSEHKAVLQMDVDDYCPQHYIVKIEGGKVCIFKTSRDTGQSELYLDLKLDTSAVRSEELPRLMDGVVFESTNEVNDYLYSLKN